MVRYRKLTEEDLDIFIRLRIRQLLEEGAEETTDLYPALMDYYRRHLADETFFSYLAVDGEVIVGTSGLSIVEKPPWFGCKNGRIGLLSSMYTLPEYRRRGIAKRLLTFIAEEARRRDCSLIQITASEMGVPLYEAFGFKRNERFLQFVL